MRSAILLGALAACTYPEKEFADPFGCLNAPPPQTTTVPVISLSGAVRDPFELTEDKQPIFLPNVSLTLDRNTSVIAGPDLSGPQGEYEFSFATNGTAFNDLVISATSSGRVTTHVTPPRAVTDNLEFPITMMSNAQLAGLAMQAGRTLPPGRGTVLMDVRDCNFAQLEGATVTSNQGGAVVYFDGVFPDPLATATDAIGVVMVADLPPGKVALTATVGGKQFPPRTVTIVADEVVQTVMLP